MPSLCCFLLTTDSYQDWNCVNGDFKQFLLADKLVACCKLYIIGYAALYNTGSVTFGIVCLLWCCLRCFIIAYHLKRNYTTWIKTRISCMIISFGTGVALLFCGMVVPKDNALHTIAFPVFTIVIVLIDGVVLLVRAQEKKTGGNEQAIRDLIIKLVEITISIIRLVDFKAHTHKHWDAEKILRLVGCSLPVLIGICLICFMLYNVRTLFLPKLIEWRGKTTRVFAVDQDGELRTLFLSKLIEWRSKIARVFAVDQDGDVQGQPAEDGTVDVELRIQGQVAEDGTVDVELRMQGQAAEDGTVDVELGTLFLSKLIEWRGMITRVFAVDQDGDVQGQAAEDGIVDV
ncbi:hypothetical protein ACQ4PT_011935 [Festuca glaucescens]